MENTTELRDSGQRAARDDETRRGTTAGRVARDSRGKSKGALVQFYDDLGFSTTPELAAVYRQDEKDYQSAVSAKQREISKATGEYNKAQSSYNSSAKELKKAQKKIPSLSEGVNKSWKDYQRGLVGIRVMGRNDKIEGTYYLPKDAAKAFVGQKGIYSSWHNSNRNLNVMVKGYGNQKVHDILRNNSKKLESNYKSAAAKKIAPEIAKANKVIQQRASEMSKAKGQLSDYKSQLDSANTVLRGSIAQREQQWADIREKYKSKTENMKNILGGLSIG